MIATHPDHRSAHGVGDDPKVAAEGRRRRRLRGAVAPQEVADDKERRRDREPAGNTLVRGGDAIHGFTRLGCGGDRPAADHGAETLAATLERDALAWAGSRHGNQVRLLPMGDVEPAVLTARLAIVAASLGDPIAADMDAYVEANPPVTTVVDLERALAARGGPWWPLQAQSPCWCWWCR